MPKRGSDDPRLVRGGVHSTRARFSRRRLSDIERLKDIVQALNGEVRDKAMIIVEGPNDSKALEELGVVAEPFLYSHNSDHMELFQLAHSFSKVIILVDNDKEGWSICKKLMSAFSEKGIKYDIWYRRQFYKIGGGSILHLEEFPSLIRRYS
ncbi:MAG: toprim domain-containing protein [Nitrososphaeria archaeon]